MPTPRTSRRRLLGALVALPLAAGLAACGSDDPDSPDTTTAPGDTTDTTGEAAGAVRECGTAAATASLPAPTDHTIDIVGFAVPEAANTAIAEAFAQTPEGEGVGFTGSYGASGDQSRAVVGGLEADYVHFSVTSDVTRLEDEGLVDPGWDDGPNHGIVSTSVVVFGVRDGNPLGIDSWDDLLQDGVEIVTPNPASSGAARWNAWAAYGQVIEDGGTEEQAEQYLRDFFANVVSLPNSGRDATTGFLSGTGNVLMAYENEAILACQNGQGFDYVIPETTLLIENPGAILIDSDPAAQDWIDFVLSPEGQAQFALKGFRPIPGVEVDVDEVPGANDPSNPFPEITNLLTIADDFGSFGEASERFFDEDTGIATAIIAETGLATG